MNRLAVGFSVTHALLALVVFGSAIAYPARTGLLPLVMFCVDLPVSLLFELIASKFGDAYSARLLADAILYLIGGSSWYFAIGYLFSIVTRSKNNI